MGRKSVKQSQRNPSYELTSLVHGEEEAKKAQEGARALFSGGADTTHMPTTELTDEDFAEEGTIDLITMLIKAGLVPTRSEGRRAIEQGGVSIDGAVSYTHLTLPTILRV